MWAKVWKKIEHLEFVLSIKSLRRRKRVKVQLRV